MRRVVRWVLQGRRVPASGISDDERDTLIRYLDRKEPGG
jgi:hypothetical protein